ncbi:MAG: GNAT family N-acetyltransferase [Candidatus Bathyarchaeota archaeon]|nr:MAG: GNAT family N-acetyltransferase [Candidatus Bathyarchaeota archaeon]
MEIFPLDSRLEDIFWSYVYQDVPHHHFFILDWKFEKNSTKILLALEENRIKGMMLTYRQGIVQLRGSAEAANALLDHLDLEKVEVQALMEHENMVLRRYKPLTRHELILMTLRRGEERLHIKHPVVELNPTDAKEIACLMRQADPEWWGETASQRVVEGMGERLWLGIKVDGKLVSLGVTRFTEWGSNIGVVVTEASHRCKGYATSMVSTLVKEILARSPMAFIHVLSDNPPAIHVYKKVGFKPYRVYFFARGEKR